MSEGLAENIRRCHPMGWSFTPLSGKKPTLMAWQERPRETLDEALAWVGKGNVGLRTGRTSNVVVVDVDPGADLSPLDLPETVTALTGRQGARHLYFQHDGPLGNSSGKLGSHVDVKADGGQVVFPGSVHPDTGRRYEWAEGCEPWNTEIAELPAHILARLRPPDTPPSPPRAATLAHVGQTAAKGDPYAKAALKRELGALCAATEGQRNDILNTAAFSLGTLIGAGHLDRQGVEHALRQAALAVGLGRQEIDATIRSGIESGMQQPRQVPEPRSNGNVSRASGEAGKEGLPQIILTDVQLSDLTGQGLDAVRRANVPPLIFVRSGSLCRVTRNEDGQPGIDGPDKVKVRARLADVATFYTINKGGDHIGANPPLCLAENILAQGIWDFPPLVGVARSPILRHDGTICTTPGYDAESRLYYCPDPGLIVPPIPDDPSLEEIEAARDGLVDLIEEFPFADSASLANSLAILLSVLMRPVISGHVPLAIVDAPMQGTGKTLMVSALGIVAAGMVSGESVPSRQNDDEWRKKITSVLLKGPPLVLLDNVPDNTTLSAPALAAMLTTHLWSDRLLGKNDNVQLPVRSIWVATGNNLRVSGDMPRRCYTVRQDANTERPWTRTGFRHADLERYAHESRGQLLASAFTLIRAWYAAGKPKADAPAFGSFQEWADTIGGVIACAGIEGFLGNLEDVRSIQDEDTLQWEAFFAAWWEHFQDGAVTAADVARLILPRNDHLYDEPAPEPLRESLPEPLLVNRDRGEGSLKRSIGKNLSRLTGRIFDGRKLSDAGTDTHRKVRAWRLMSTGRPCAGLVTPQVDRNPAANPAEGDEL